MDILLTHYGWEGLALMVMLLIMFCVQLYYYSAVFGRIAGYRNNRRRTMLDTEPPLSVVIPLFSEDASFIEERLPLMLAQEYDDFEIVLVYVGSNGDFYEDLVHLGQSFSQITVTKIHLDPRFPISRKMALNVGIKSARNECMVFSSSEVSPRSDRWLSLMAKGFCKGEIVIGYCGIERAPGFGNYMIRTWRLMHSADWLGAAVCHRPYRGTQHNLGFTKSIYFGANGFNHLSMNIGEEDLFMQEVMTPDNVSVILSPRASLSEKPWGGFRWWLSVERYFGAATQFYPRQIKNHIQWELGSRLLFFLLALFAIALLPVELKIVAGVLMLLRYGVVFSVVRRLATRLGEAGIAGRYLFYDLLSPWLSILLWVVQIRKDERVWR